MALFNKKKLCLESAGGLRSAGARPVRSVAHWEGKTLPAPLPSGAVQVQPGHKAPESAVVFARRLVVGNTALMNLEVFQTGKMCVVFLFYFYFTLFFYFNFFKLRLAYCFFCFCFMFQLFLFIVVLLLCGGISFPSFFFSFLMGSLLNFHI
jgi:hypothetical protein